MPCTSLTGGSHHFFHESSSNPNSHHRMRQYRVQGTQKLPVLDSKHQAAWEAAFKRHFQASSRTVATKHIRAWTPAFRSCPHILLAFRLAQSGAILQEQSPSNFPRASRCISRTCRSLRDKGHNPTFVALEGLPTQAQLRAQHSECGDACSALHTLPAE